MARGKSSIVVALGDLHCGHRNGLTPPGWQESAKRPGSARAGQVEAWARYEAIRRRLPQPDVVLALGDMIDGRGEASGGTELLTTDRAEQAQIAVECLRIWQPKRGYAIVRGTPYHAGQLEEFEDAVAAGLGCDRIADRLYPEVDGVTFDLAHEVGASSVPHARFTSVAREALWSLIAAADGVAPRVQVVLRAHVHYHVYCGAAGGPLAMTLPALQTSTRFGRRRVRRVCHWGLVWFEVQNGRVVRWAAECVQLRSARAETCRI
jgi:hypothetical protein